jgi:hypothetical protein
MSCHVRRTRVTDTSAAHALGGPDQTGKIAYSRTFRTETAAQREADAWNGAGDFARHGPTDWHAEVLPGPAPRRAA